MATPHLILKAPGWLSAQLSVLLILGGAMRAQAADASPSLLADRDLYGEHTSGPGEEAPKFKVTTKRDSDKVAIEVEKNTATFLLRSPTGISHAVIERKEQNWPDTITLKLYLTGLESLKVSNGKIALSAAVSSSSNPPTVRLWQDGQEDRPLDPKSPLWMEIRMVSSDGKPVRAIPLKDGYFEMRLPKAFIEGNPKTITVNWIDFYRN